MEEVENASAWLRIEDLTIDIVLTDYSMPEIIGYDLLKVIKVLNASSIKLSHYFQILFKFILLSSYAVLCFSELLHRWSNASNGSFLAAFSS